MYEHKRHPDEIETDPADEIDYGHTINSEDLVEDLDEDTDRQAEVAYIDEKLKREKEEANDDDL